MNAKNAKELKNSQSAMNAEKENIAKNAKVLKKAKHAENIIKAGKAKKATNFGGCKQGKERKFCKNFQ